MVSLFHILLISKDLAHFNNKDHVIHLHLIRGNFHLILYQANWIRKMEGQGFNWLCAAVLIHLNKSMDLINNPFDFFFIIKK